ncbi:MAG: hydroxymethylglutaryl-CoA synthase, partial [Acidimicrobiales bacterium]
MAAGIVSWGVYLPYWRLDRGAIGAAFGTPPGKGTRAVASYDEDTTTLGMEAARRALDFAEVPDPDDLYFSTPAPAYMDKTNATTIHAALGLSASSGAYDLCGSVRSGWATLTLSALSGEQRPSMAVISDLRTGLAGGAEESQAGDGAVAFVFAPEGGVAELIGQASATDEFLDRWRVPGESASHQWEERFGEEAYL